MPQQKTCLAQSTWFLKTFSMCSEFNVACGEIIQIRHCSVSGRKDFKNFKTKSHNDPTNELVQRRCVV